MKFLLDFGVTFYENSLGIFFVGNYTDETLSEKQIKAVETLIKNGTDQKLLESEPEIYSRYELESGEDRWDWLNLDGTTINYAKGKINI